MRHLVLPEGLAGTPGILRFIAEEISPNTYVNIMDQYHPCGEAVGKPRIGRRIKRSEFREALEIAENVGLKRIDEKVQALYIYKNLILADYILDGCFGA